MIRLAVVLGCLGTVLAFAELKDITFSSTLGRSLQINLGELVSGETARLPAVVRGFEGGQGYACSNGGLTDLHSRFVEALVTGLQKPYLQQYSGEAEKRLQTALNTSSPVQVDDAAFRFPLTQAAKHAFGWLISYHLDRGRCDISQEYAEAMLRQFPLGDSGYAPSTLLKLWAVFTCNGQISRAEAVQKFLANDSETTRRLESDRKSTRLNSSH